MVHHHLVYGITVPVLDSGTPQQGKASRRGPTWDLMHKAIGISWDTWDFAGFTMVLPWFYHGFTMVIIWLLKIYLGKGHHISLT